MRELPGRINLVTLGVADVGRATAFYEALGFPRFHWDSDAVAFFQLDGTVLGLFGLADLAEDAGIERTQAAGGGASLAINFASEAEVDAALTFAGHCGGRITQPARKVFWGGYSGYFSDPDGHLWELAYNPHFPLDARGHFNLKPGSGS